MINVLIMIAGLLYSFPGKAEVIGVHYYELDKGGACKTLVIAPTDEAMLQMRLARPKLVCLEKYGPRSPCLVKYEQVGANDFKATCGAKQ